MKSVTTILFVENDAVALTMYQKRLQREGFHVETAEDGIAALRVLSEMTPDIVVLDLMLSKFSGKDVFDYMRADTQFKKVPVIIFSNAPQSEWPQNPEASPTRALPKSEANFASLVALVREMTAASAVPEAVAAPGPSAAATTIPPAADALPPAPASVAQSASGVVAPAQSAATDNGSPAETTEQFFEYATADMAAIREHCLAFIKAPNTDAGRGNLSSLRQRLQALNVGAQKINCTRLGVLATAWEALLAEIERKPSIASPSILQTLAQAADCLRILLSNGSTRSMEPVPKARVLSVDDDEICNDVAVSALERSNMGADSVMDANAALELLKQRDYDMVLLDINMPGLTGFELCEKLRAMPHHQKTPVIFVTAFNNFENRKQSVLSGGGDLIAKPVSPLELALKVTIHLLKAPPKTVTAPQGQAKPAPAPEAQAKPAPAPKEQAKPEVAPQAPAKEEPALVWKDPVQTISHDAEIPGKNPKTGDAHLPALPAIPIPVAAPEPSIVEAKIKAPASESSTPAVALKSEAAQALAAALKPSAPIPAPQIEKPAVKAVESKPILESVAPSRPLPEKAAVVPTQPPRISQPAAPLSTGGSKISKTMNKETNQQFDSLVLDVAHIIFGDNAPEINVRLVRMALEQVWQNRANLESIDSIAREIARIIFGETSATELNVRLVRMALEHSNSIALFKAA